LLQSIDREAGHHRNGDLAIALVGLIAGAARLPQEQARLLVPKPLAVRTRRIASGTWRRVSASTASSGQPAGRLMMAPPPPAQVVCHESNRL
jgi:hypothetical protein